jgi:hypothetical protein
MPSSNDWTWKPTGEDYDLAGYLFSVDRAKRLIARVPRPVEMILVEEYAWFVIDGIVPIRSAGSSKYRLDVPVIVGTLRSGKRVLLDGWHRLKKAMDTGVKELPAVILTQEETMMIRRR